jgi:hypothetical protein
MAHHQQEYSTNLRESLIGDWNPGQAEVVWASKARLHYRPVLVLPLDVRVVYRAVIQDALGAIPSREDQNQTWADMVSGILAPGVRAIATADVAAFFQFIDHEAACQEVVNQTARGDSALVIRALLGHITGRAFGLPQALDSSRHLTDAFIAPVERGMLQAGWNLTRSSDDFRIGCETTPEAFRAMEQLQELLYRRGLKQTGAQVMAWRQGVYGPALIAAGLDGYETGIGILERSRIADATTSRRPPEDVAEASGRGAPARVLLEALGRSIPGRAARILLEDKRTRHRLMCIEETCCPDGVTSTIKDNRGHGVRTRWRQLKALEDMPQPKWRLYNISDHSRQAATLAAQANKILAEHGLHESLPVAGMESLARVAEFLRATD